MTKEDLAKARNLSYEGMLIAQSLMDWAWTEWEKTLADLLYRANWAAYLLTLDKERQIKKKRMEEQDTQPDSPEKYGTLGGLGNEDDREAQ